MRLLASVLAGLLSFGGCASAQAQSIDAGVPKPPPTFELGPVDFESVNTLIDEMDDAKEAGAKAINITIDSPGGSVFSGFRLIEHMEDLGLPIHCTVRTMAASMAFSILQACTTRTISRRSILMAHEASLSGAIDDGHEQDFRNLAERMRVINAMVAEYNAGRMGISVATYNERVSGGREWWMTWEDAVKAGAVDRVIDIRR